jgi:hypothetical protein
MSVTINGTSGLVFNDASTQNTAAKYGMVNRIINGAMMIDQRNAGASVTPFFVYTLDRWFAITSQTGKYTVQQNAGSVTPPAGFTNYLGITSTSAYSVGSGDTFTMAQKIEGYNVADIGYGTANASTTTLSFWVRSSLTGTFGGSLQNSDSSRSYPFSYTISSANTWEYKTVSIAGDTSGTWLKTNGVGLIVQFGLGSGSTFNSGSANSWSSTNTNQPSGTVSVVGTNGATFYITGVQLEKGSTATSFDYRPYGTELLLCQRYCYVDGYTGNAYTRFPLAYATSTTQSLTVLNFPVTMRTVPSLTWSGPFAEVLNSGGGATGTSVTITTDGNSASHAAVSFVYSSGTVASNSTNAIRINNSTSWYARFEAEL